MHFYALKFSRVRIAPSQSLRIAQPPSAASPARPSPPSFGPTPGADPAHRRGPPAARRHRLAIADAVAAARRAPPAAWTGPDGDEGGPGGEGGGAPLVCRRERALEDSVRAFRRRPSLARGPAAVVFDGEPATGEGVLRE